MSVTHIAVLVGSLRAGSLNRMVAEHLAGHAPADLALSIVPIGELALYNPDLDETPPETWTTFRETIRAADAVLFVTPEYNRSVPGALKNAIDVGSRPYGQSVFARKPAAIISVSPGAMGAFGANHHLRQSLVFLDMAVMAQPEAYVGGAAKLFDADAKLVNKGTAEFLNSFLRAFAGWISRFKAV